MNGAGLLLQSSGLPSEAWTRKARARTLVYAAGACATIGSVFSVATWYLASQHIEGMGGIIAYSAFLLWVGGAVFGLIGGIVAACATTDEEQQVSLRIIGTNGALFLLAALFFATR